MPIIAQLARNAKNFRRIVTSVNSSIPLRQIKPPSAKRLRPDVQIISRSNLDRNVHVLHAAGANLVLSLASLVSTRIINLLEPGRVFMLNEGLNIFRADAGVELAGKTLINSGIRKNTRCNVVAVKTVEGDMLVNPDPKREFHEGDELFLIGDSEAETAYYERYWPDRGFMEEEEPSAEKSLRAVLFR